MTAVYFDVVATVGRDDPKAAPTLPSFLVMVLSSLDLIDIDWTLLRAPTLGRLLGEFILKTSLAGVG